MNLRYVTVQSELHQSNNFKTLTYRF